MTLDASEFTRRFLLHVLPSGFYRIRHYGFLASRGRAATIGRLRDQIATSNATARLAPKPMQARPRPPPSPPQPKPAPGSVPAAADACASSRRSPVALVLAASPPNLPELTRHDRRSGPRRHRPLLAEDLPRRRSVRARADRGDQRLAPPCPRNARLCRSANPRPVRRPRVIHKHATPAVPRGAAEPQIPIAPPRRRTLTVPRFPPLEAFGRRPPARTYARVRAGIRNPTKERALAEGVEIWANLIKRSFGTAAVCHSSGDCAIEDFGLRADFMPRFATRDLNGRHTATGELSLRTIGFSGL